jgi:hypothetical protein
VRDWVVLIACGLIGWGVVSWLISVVRPPQPSSVKDPEPTPLRLTNEPRPTAEAGPAPAADMETAWPAILQVDKGATAAEIENAYHAILAECDRVRFSTWYSAQERQEAEARRATVCAAYEFIRPRR